MQTTKENTVFNKDFYPTPEETIQTMLSGIDIAGKHFLEPEAGNAKIVDYLNSLGAKSVTTYEKIEAFKSMLQTKSNFKGSDFLEATKEDISHVDFIVMNPPFSKDVEHILHAWRIAPEGCHIISLINSESLENTFTRKRKELAWLIGTDGDSEKLGNVFKNSDRKTNVEVSLINLFKPIVSEDFDYSDFFTDEEPDENSSKAGLIPYNEVREIVQRYIGAVKCFEEMKAVNEKMNNYIKPIGLSDGFNFQVQYGKTVKTKEDFAKDLQKKSWEWIFKKLNVRKYVTSGVVEKINKFVETQSKYPFTMKNIYKMIEIIVKTRSQTMDAALVEAFDKITKHHDKNRYNVEGWKTNKHYLVDKKFILEFVTEPTFGGNMGIRYNGNHDKVSDLHKALCYITGEKPKDIKRKDKDGNHPELEEFNVWHHKMNLDFSTWYDYGFFKIKGFKKGTLHVKFKDLKVWELFNRKVAEIKGFPLPEKI